MGRGLWGKAGMGGEERDGRGDSGCGLAVFSAVVEILRRSGG